MKKQIINIMVFILITLSLFNGCFVTKTNSSNIETEITEEDQDWLIIGGQKVKNFEIPRIYDYYLKSEILDIKDILIHINPKNENITNSLEGIELLANLEGLGIIGYNLNLVDYSPLNNLQKLREITLESGNTDKLTAIPDFSSLSSRESIKRFTLNKCMLTNLNNIEHFPNLQFLDVYSNYGDLSDIKAINQLKHLEELNLLSGNNSIIRVAEIIPLPKLKKLWLIGKLIDLNGIETLTALEDIRFVKSEILNMQSLSGLNNLKQLQIEIENANPNINFLEKMINLEYLILYANTDTWEIKTKTPYQILNLIALEKLYQLNYLELRGFIIQNIWSVNNLNNISNIYAYDSILFDDTETTIKNLIFYHRR